MLVSVSNDQGRDRRVGVPASAPAWLRELNEAVLEAEVNVGQLRSDEAEVLRDAAERLGRLAGLRPGPATRAQSALDRTHTMLAAAVMAATGTASAELQAPQLWLAGKNLAVMLVAAAAVQNPSD
jgi:hypothetical protein